MKQNRQPKLKKNGEPYGSRTRVATESQRLLTISQSSKIYGPPQRTIYDWIAMGALQYVRFPGGRTIWLERQDIEALIMKSREGR